MCDTLSDRKPLGEHKTLLVMADNAKRWLRFNIREICYVTVAVVIFCVGYRTGWRQSRSEHVRLITQIVKLRDQVDRTVNERQTLHAVSSPVLNHTEPSVVLLRTTWFDTFVHVSIGSGDGIRKGHQLIVDRPHDSMSTDRKVTVEVLETSRGSCICRPIREQPIVPLDFNEA